MERYAPVYSAGAGAAARGGVKRKASDGLPARSGPPLLLISGLGQNSPAWMPIVPMLRDTFSCITFDNRGTGRSDTPPGPYTIDQLADDTAALIEHLEA